MVADVILRVDGRWRRVCRFRKRELRGRIGIGIGIGDVEKAANVNTVDVNVDVEIDVLRQARPWTSICFIYYI